MADPVPLIGKHPDAKPWLLLDWTDYAAGIGGPTITDSAWADGGDSSIGFEADSIDGLTTKVRLTGGADGETAYVENTVTFSDGAVEVYTVTVVIADKVPD